jgi:uncharacterized protein GlcG (DUF336 family)
LVFEVLPQGFAIGLMAPDQGLIEEGVKVMHKSSGALALGGLLVAAIAATAAGALRESIASPRSLPTDALPPFSMLDDSGKLVPLPDPKALAAFASPATGGAVKKVALPRPLALDLATDALRASLATCARMGFPIAAAVVDSEGKPVAMMIEAGSEGSVFVAMRKAATALGYKVPSSTVGAALPADKVRLEKLTPVMFIAGGALPIWRGKELIGAIAASGAHGEGPIGTQDEACAKAGLERIAARIM